MASLDGDAAAEEHMPFVPFRFLDLPPEIRREILDYLLIRSGSIDIDVKAHGTLSRFLLVSKQFCEEAASSFYGGNTFRILPTHPRAAGRYARPLLRDFSRWHRSMIVSLELRLGPFWSDPPKCWKITKRMGLEQVNSLRLLKVFIEIDPSHPVFNGFRGTKKPYHVFCSDLLDQILGRLPKVEEVRFDAYASASRGMLLMDTLVELARSHGKRISWGPYQRAIDVEREHSWSYSDSDTAFLSDMMSSLCSPPILERRSLPKSLLM